MKIKEFGNESKPVIILIHGGGLGYRSWNKVIEEIKNDFCIKTVIIDGHGEDFESDFISIEETASKIESYFKSIGISKVHGICGLSIGAQITVELLSRNAELAENWLIESALVIKMEKITKLVLPLITLMYPLVKMRWYAKLQSQTLQIEDSLFEKYYEDSSKMSLNTLRAVTESNSNYELKKPTIISKSNVQIFVGSREPKIMLKSAKLLSESIEGSKLQILQGFKHGEFSLKHTKKYVETIKSFKA